MALYDQIWAAVRYQVQHNLYPTMISKQKYYVWLVNEVHITQESSIVICWYLGVKVIKYEYWNEKLKTGDEVEIKVW